MSSVVLRAFGETLTGRWPTVDELEAASSREPTAIKALCVACFPSMGELLKRKPAAYMRIGLILLGLSGVGGPLLEVSEDELQDGDPMVAAWAEAERKGFKGIHLVRYTRATPAFDASFLLREPHQRDVDEYLTRETFQAAKAFAKKHCVHGDIEALGNEAPGLVRAITLFLFEKVGGTEDVLLGEA